jgi:formate hydrogenlyase subunit 6/NADH:ubiquinone oxidoreductase subunit I
VEACPTDAITHGTSSTASYNTSTLIYRKSGASALNASKP